MVDGSAIDRRAGGRVGSCRVPAGFLGDPFVLLLVLRCLPMERLGDWGPPLSKSGGELITEITHTRKWQGTGDTQQGAWRRSGWAGCMNSGGWLALAEGLEEVSRFGLAVRRWAGKAEGPRPVRIRFGSPFSLKKKIVVCGHCLVTSSLISPIAVSPLRV